jgi:hypothetical protein
MVLYLYGPFRSFVAILISSSLFIPFHSVSSSRFLNKRGIRRGKQQRLRMKRYENAQSIVNTPTELKRMAGTNLTCPLCNLVLTTPVLLCQHYYDINCFVKTEHNTVCPDEACMVPPRAATMYPLHTYRLDYAKLAQVDHMIVDLVPQYRKHRDLELAIYHDLMIYETKQRLRTFLINSH